MTTRLVNHAEEHTGLLEIELLNQACLDLVAQIEELKKENARLKKLNARKADEAGGMDLRVPG